MQTTQTSTMSVLQRLKGYAQLSQLTQNHVTLQPSQPRYALLVAKSSRAIVELLQLLGHAAGKPSPAQKAEEDAFDANVQGETLAQPRTSSADHYVYEDRVTHGQRKKANKAAIDLLKQIDGGEIDETALTEDQKATLAKYSGLGGGLEGADGTEGSAYEYYTPKPIAEGVWSMLGEIGFAGGKVLDPCAGTGIFGATAPLNAAIEAVELDATSGRINQLVNGGAGYSATVSPFEAVASRTPDGIYDAVVTNVPFGSNSARGANKKHDPRYQGESLEWYFMCRSIEKLRGGGLAAFIVPPRCVSEKGGKAEKLRLELSKMAEFMGAYRLPNQVFGNAEADTITDVVVFRKFGDDASLKVAELAAQNPQALIDAKVLWQEFIGGNYFQGEGKRYVLGEFQAKDKTKFRDVDRVISNQSVPDIAKLLKKFGGSRIDWAALNEQETEPLIYEEGDTTVLAGETLEMRGGVWVSVGSATQGTNTEAVLNSMYTPLKAVVNGVTYAAASECVASMVAAGKVLDIPVWIASSINALSRLNASEVEAHWKACATGLATIDVANEHATEAGFNFYENYSQLTQALIDTVATAKKAPTHFNEKMKAGYAKARITYNKKTGFAAYWKGANGEVAVSATAGDEQSRIMALRYTQGLRMKVEDVEAIMGEGFSVMESPDWVITADGTQAMRADDYYVGSLSEKLAELDISIAAATNEQVKGKLLRMRENAMERVRKVDVKALRFNLFSPFVTMEEKAEFLRRFLGQGFATAVNNEGKPCIVYEGREETTEQQLYSRIAIYVSGDAGGRGIRSLTIGSKRLAISDKAALEALRKIAARLNTQIDSYVKASPAIIDRLAERANAQDALYFEEVDDGAELDLVGVRKIDPTSGEPFAPHNYQNAFVRKMGRRMSGILGFDVGLGKTFTALLVAQYVQSIGVKKKTIFVLPNTVLTNWKREAGRAYTDETMAGCLFIGLTQDRHGEDTVKPAQYAADFTRILEGKHSKIFCTLEAFAQIPLKDATIDAYEAHMMAVDSAYEAGEKRKDRESASSRLTDLTTGSTGKSSAIPFFEDMGIDSLVIDEAHSFKNSKSTSEFSGGRFLSIAEASQRGIDMQMKSWYVRGQSPNKDGVMPLTATPVTNSPLEIYSMLTLAAGEERINKACMGVSGADEFMNAMCVMDSYEDIGIDGKVKNYRVFTGLQNVSLLRSVMSSVTTIKTATDVDGGSFKQPEKNETAIDVTLPQDTLKRLEDYKMAYRAAKYVTGTAAKDAEEPSEQEMDALARVQERLNEPPELIAHPFNLAQKMSNLIVDPELDERATFYVIHDRAMAIKLVEAFNKTKREEQRARPSPWTKTENIGKPVVKKTADGEEVLERINVQAAIAKDGRIVVDTVSYKNQAAFEALADKLGIDLQCRVPAKIAALVGNVKLERQRPRSKSGLVKQIVFCDSLGTHLKLRRILAKETGIPLAKIAVVNGQSISDPAEMQDVQDGFNSEGAENRYELIVANKKAEVGINLQKGTAAIHHLTIGWTPDSQHQRNGRAARQGNDIAVVNIYHYDAQGTFDKYKRDVTNAKADWIGAVMSSQGGNDVAVQQGLTDAQMDEMIESMGDAKMLNDFQAKAKLKEELQRAENARQRQLIAVQTIAAQSEYLKKYKSESDWLNAVAKQFGELAEKHRSLVSRPRTKMRPENSIRLDAAIAEISTRLSAMAHDLVEAADFTIGYRGQPMQAGELYDQYQKAETKQKRVKSWESMLWRVSLKNKDARIFEEWAAEKAGAEAVMREALELFKGVAANERGAIPLSISEQIETGKFTVYGDVLVAANMLTEIEGEVYVALDSGSSMHGAKGGTLSRNVIQYMLSKTGAVLATQGTDEFAKLVKLAAQQEDEREKAGQISQYTRNTLVSAHIPEVAQARQIKAKASSYFVYLAMPEPHYPYVLAPAKAGSEFFMSLHKAQADLGWFSFDANKIMATYEIDLPIEKINPDYDKRCNALISRAKAAGKKLWAIDVMSQQNSDAVFSFLIAGAHIDQKVPAGMFDAAVTLEEVDAIQKAFIESKYAEWLEWGGEKGEVSFASASVLPPSMRFEMLALKSAAQERINAAAEALAKAAAAEKVALEPEVQVQEIAVAAPVVDGVTPNARGMIGINGDTLHKMDGLNAKGRPLTAKDFLRKSEKESGEPLSWKKDLQHWETTPKLWAYCCENYPDAAKHMRAFQL